MADATRYLSGNFAPVDQELTATDLEVTGSIPESLRGTYARIGPNPLAAPDPATHHWFVGDGMVHGVSLRDGRAEWYRNRWIRTDEVAQALGEAPVGGPDQPLFDTANTNVTKFGTTTYAMTEMAVPYELDDELATVGRVDFGGLPNGFTAHPKVDVATGEWHAIGYSIVEPYLRYYVISPSGQVTVDEPIEIGGPASIHDVAISETYVVLFDLPVVLNMDAAAAGLAFPYRWDDSYQARVGLLPKGGTNAD